MITALAIIAAALATIAFYSLLARNAPVMVEQTSGIPLPPAPVAAIIEWDRAA